MFHRLTAAALALVLLLSFLPLCAFGEENGVLSLPGKAARELDTLMETIAAAPGVTRVVFDQTPLSLDVLNALKERFPELELEYSLSFFGRKVRSTDETVNLYPNKISGGKQYQKLLELLRYLPHVTELRAWDSSFTYDELEEIRAILPNVHVSCKLRVNKHYVRNDITAFGTRHSYHSTRYTSEDMRVLKYMDNLLALDIGHNAITDLSFLYDLPNLRVLILADNQITDLTPIASLKDLEYLEIFKNPVTDLGPLAKLTQLIDLNMTFCDVSDYAPLLGLTKLDRLWISDNPFTDDQLQTLHDALPNCTINTTAGAIAPTAEGWRQKHPRYLQIVKIFDTGRYKEFKTE